MNARIRRRDFLKATPVAAGMMSASGRRSLSALAPAVIQSKVKLSGSGYVPSADYPRQPVPFWEITLKDGFWDSKVRTNAEVTIPFEFRKFEESGRPVSNNVLEAAIYSLRMHPDAGLQAQVEARIRDIKSGQEARPGAGNSFFEVAAAYYSVTGKRDLLDVAIRSAEALYQALQAAPPRFTGGERDAINCVQLYRATGEKKHLDLARYYLDIRGLENSLNRSRHNQSYKPVLEQTEAVGHAVNDASLMVSLADVGVLTGIEDYWNAAQSIWLDVVNRKFYVTGGIGSTGNEGFGAPYSLPNLSAYCESCAAFMFATFNHRMFLATGEARYIDVMERTLYNNAVSAVSASGNRFFYVNRLASAGDGRDLRWEKASLECCPPNLVRFLASMPGYIYARNRDEVYVNLYVSSEVTFEIDGKNLGFSVESVMPWGGRSRITISAGDRIPAEVKLRIPGWAINRPVPTELYSYLDRSSGTPRVSLNGEEIPCAIDRSGYLSLRRDWKVGDVLEIEFPFEVRKVVADPKVKEDRGRMAVERGPVVYCAEWPDCRDGQVLNLLLDPAGELTPSFDERFFGGVAVINGKAKNIAHPLSEPAALKLIPYYLWANRGAGEMSVWLSIAEYAAGDTGPAGGLIFYVNPNFARDGWRYLEAAPFDQSAGAKWGCFRTLIPGARGTAVGTGKQNTMEITSACGTAGSAAELCANYRLNGIGGWFLPSVDELALMYVNLKLAGIVDFGVGDIADNYGYWSSSQRSADMAFHLDFADNGRRQHYDDKDFPRRVRAVRAI